MKRGSDSSEDTSSDCFVIQHNPQPLTTRKHEDDEKISGTEAMLRKRKQLKTRKTLLEASSSGAWKMSWTKTEELLILKVYDRIRGSMESDFSKKQLTNKIEKMKLRFRNYETRSSAGKRLSLTNAHDEQVFRLSMTIWGENNKTKSASTENINMDQRKVRESNATDDGETDKSEDLNVLQEALEMAASFRSLGSYQQRSLLRNLKNIGATQRKELTDEWKALLAQDMQLGIKKQSFYAKLVNTGFSA